MIEKTLWHPVALQDDLGAAPLAVRLLDQDLVLWRPHSGPVQAWPDRCPHRGARLSLGRVQGNTLQCAYHGWQFDAQGQCQRVPALPDFKPPPTHCAPRHEACERYGLIWVRLQTPQAAGAPLPDFCGEHAGLRQVNCGPYDVATSAPRVVENFLDMAHFGFVHDGWLGDLQRPEIEPYEVEETATGVRAHGCKAWQPRSNLHATSGAQIGYGYEVTGPYSAVLTKVPEAGSALPPGWQEAIALFICPVSEESCRVWFRLAMADFESSDASLRAFQHTIFTQDQPVLQSQRPRRLPLDARSELHASVDRLSLAYRRHLRQLGITYGVC
jgi:phenylpropionate dioxygenase-like ring-hydroxylating dioxygenase large terminal subunit